MWFISSITTSLLLSCPFSLIKTRQEYFLSKCQYYGFVWECICAIIRDCVCVPPCFLLVWDAKCLRVRMFICLWPSIVHFVYILYTICVHLIHTLCGCVWRGCVWLGAHLSLFLCVCMCVRTYVIACICVRIRH